MRNQVKDRLNLFGTFAVTALPLTAVVAFWQTRSYDDLHEHYNALADSTVATMHENLERIVSTTSMLKALVITYNGDTAFFNGQAPLIYRQAVEATGVSLRNIVLAPNGVVTKDFPKEGNESLMGFNFYDSSKPGNASAIKARDTNSLILTNPFELTQGGTAVSARQPVTLTKDGKKKQWGLVTTTLDFDELIKFLQLETLSANNANYRLWYESDDGQQVTIASSETLPDQPVTHQLSTMGVNWYLDVAPCAGWINWTEAGIGEAIALLLAALIAFASLQRSRVKRANETLRRLANLDSLTACFSRHYVNTILISQPSGNWNDPHAKYSLIICDIDRFKSINDTYGHDIGDKAIVTIANILKDNTCPEDGDCVIRHGGDEFVIVYNDVTLKRFKDKLETISQQVRDARVPGAPDLRMTVSLGAEYYSDPETSRYYDMLNRADKKLYEAKEGGRDLIVL